MTDYNCVLHYSSREEMHDNYFELRSWAKNNNLKYWSKIVVEPEDWDIATLSNTDNNRSVTIKDDKVFVLFTLKFNKYIR